MSHIGTKLEVGPRPDLNDPASGEQSKLLDIIARQTRDVRRTAKKFGGQVSVTTNLLIQKFKTPADSEQSARASEDAYNYRKRKRPDVEQEQLNHSRLNHATPALLSFAKEDCHAITQSALSLAYTKGTTDISKTIIRE